MKRSKLVLPACMLALALGAGMVSAQPKPAQVKEVNTVGVDAYRQPVVVDCDGASGCPQFVPVTVPAGKRLVITAVSLQLVIDADSPNPAIARVSIAGTYNFYASLPGPGQVRQGNWPTTLYVEPGETLQVVSASPVGTQHAGNVTWLLVGYFVTL